MIEHLSRRIDAVFSKKNNDLHSLHLCQVLLIVFDTCSFRYQTVWYWITKLEEINDKWQVQVLDTASGASCLHHLIQ